MRVYCRVTRLVQSARLYFLSSRESIGLRFSSKTPDAASSSDCRDLSRSCRTTEARSIRGSQSQSAPPCRAQHADLYPRPLRTEMAPANARANVVRHRVTFGETDAAGVVFYPNYLRWFDEGTHELFRSLSLSFRTVLSTLGLTFPVVSVQVDFRAPLHYDDTIEVRSAIGELTARTIKVIHEVTRSDDETCSGWEVRGCVAAKNGTFVPRAIPEEIRRRLA